MLVDGINMKKKAFVDAYIQEIKKIDAIKGFILFGSVITERCRDDSDVDMLFLCDSSVFDVYGAELSKAAMMALDVQETDYDLLSVSSIEEFQTKDSFLLNHLRNSGEYKIMFVR